MSRVAVVRCLTLLHEDRGETRFAHPHAAILGCRSGPLPLCNVQKQNTTTHIREMKTIASQGYDGFVESSVS